MLKRSSLVILRICMNFVFAARHLWSANYVQVHESKKSITKIMKTRVHVWFHLTPPPRGMRVGS